MAVQEAFPMPCARLGPYSLVPALEFEPGFPVRIADCLWALPGCRLATNHELRELAARNGWILELPARPVRQLPAGIASKIES